jgi:hypothetical protein
MEFEAHRKRFFLAGPLIAVMTAVTITACGGSTPAIAQGSAPGHWTKAEISQFIAASGSAGSTSSNSCLAGYFERDMSFEYAMAVSKVITDSMSVPQVGAALVAKYGAAAGNTVFSQFKQVVSDTAINCSNDN